MTGLAVADLEVERGSFHLGPVRLGVAPGTATVLLGPSGAGKTTLLRTIAGFVPPRSGSIRLDGAVLDGRPPERRGIGFVPPNLGLFAHRTVLGNVRYPLEIAGHPDVPAAARAWMERFDLLALADRYPRELSSGERQRVAMARALAARPRLLLWDEPLAALDVESRDVLQRLVRELLETERLPLLLVTHDATTALALADRLAVLDGGRQGFDGPPEALERRALDRFTARFLGFENVYSVDELARAGDGPLACALAAVAGPGGVAVPARALEWRTGSEEPRRGRVRSLRWERDGWTVLVDDAGLCVRLRAPSDARPRIGEAVAVRVETSAVRPLRESAGDGRR